MTMFTIKRVSDDRLDIEMSGKLDSAGMRKALNELVEKSEGIKDGKMLYDVIDYQLPSFEAIVIEFSRLPSMIRFITQFKRAAVLTEKTWLKNISEFEGHFIPGLEIKGFSRNDKAAAEAWLNENE